jgi:hypothetical protein
MEDTGREIKGLQQHLWMELSEEERFRRCGEMFAVVKAFAWNRAPAEFSPDNKRRFVFRELYGFSLPTGHPRDNEWLNIVYSGFWDYPFAFVVRYKGSKYLFLRGGFDDELDDYPSEYEVYKRKDLESDGHTIGFGKVEWGEPFGRIDMRQVEFDPTHREQINSTTFKKIKNEE